MQQKEVGAGWVMLLNDIPSDERIKNIAGHYHDNSLDPQHLLLALPKGENTMSQLQAPSSPGLSALKLAILFTGITAASAGVAGLVLGEVAAACTALVAGGLAVTQHKRPEGFIKPGSAFFYQEDDLVQFSPADLLSFLQRWVNADPENHTRRVLFDTLHNAGQPDLANRCLQGTDPIKLRSADGEFFARTNHTFIHKCTAVWRTEYRNN